MADRTDEVAAGASEQPAPAAAGIAGDVLDPGEQPAPAGRHRRAMDQLPRIGGGWALLFLLPALVVLGALVVYPIGYTIWRSFFSAAGSDFVGLENYGDLFADDATFTALKNNAIWVVVAPAVVTSLGLFFAVLTERIRWAAAFKLLIFMPMAISFLAAGVIFRSVYDQEPERGVLNAVVVSVHDMFSESGQYQGVRARDADALAAEGGGFATAQAVPATEPIQLGFVALPPDRVPTDAIQAVAPPAGPGLRGVIWLDFAQGGGGEPNQIDPNEVGLPDMRVQAVQDGRVVDSTTTGADGTFAFPELTDGSYTLRLPESNFGAGFNGVSWLGPTLITPAIIGSYVWIWAGFAMVLIGAGLAAIPREALEAARVDGATEWQVFRRVTIPLLAPVLLVVLVTLVINVLKIFDLVYIIAPGSTQPDANVLALQMYLASFGGGNNQGLGSAIAVALFLLVVPAMLFNIRRFRQERR
ncbi:MAG: ABC transporter permease subunit [Sporichthyaceae bacterium]|nr:ABC transporter permease subunit [Sporichthyaceae bacterium]